MNFLINVFHNSLPDVHGFCASITRTFSLKQFNENIKFAYKVAIQQQKCIIIDIHLSIAIFVYLEKG